jgi:hypothetical protein
MSPFAKLDAASIADKLAHMMSRLGNSVNDMERATDITAVSPAAMELDSKRDDAKSGVHAHVRSCVKDGMTDLKALAQSCREKFPHVSDEHIHMAIQECAAAHEQKRKDKESKGDTAAEDCGPGERKDDRSSAGHAREAATLERKAEHTDDPKMKAVLLAKAQTHREEIGRTDG